MDLDRPPSRIREHDVAVILDRLKSARDPTDRADALVHLQNLGKEEPEIVGRLAVPLVIDMLRARRLGQLDEGTAQGLLEFMRKLLSSSQAAARQDVLHLFLADPSNVDALLDMVESTDTLTTVATLQVVQAALEAGPQEFGSVLQGQSQQGMVRLVACLSDEREEVRNEVLLVLGRLTCSNSENLKTLVAFNEGFEHLLAMIEDDGGLVDGGIITHDCLRLLGNVVDSTPSAQRQFCEMGSLGALTPWFDLTPIIEESGGGEGGGNGIISGMPILDHRQRESFYLALRILRNLASAPGDDVYADDPRLAADRQKRQIQILKSSNGKLVHSLIQLGTGSFEEETTTKVQDQALLLLAELVENNQENQQMLLDAHIDPSFFAWESKSISPKDRENGSAFLSSVLLRIALHWPFAGTRAAALMLCHRLIKDNEMAGIMTIQHIIAPPLAPLDLSEDEGYLPAVPWGTVLLEELGTSLRSVIKRVGAAGSIEMEVAQTACFLLEHILVHGGLTARELASRIPFAEPENGGERKLLLDWVTAFLKQCIDMGPTVERVQIALLRLIASWIDSCQAVARALLRSPTNFFLVELLVPPSRKASGGGGGGMQDVSATVKALAAVVVGLCFEHWGDDIDDSSGLGRSEIQAMIENRVGLTTFTSTLENLERVLQPGRNFVTKWPSWKGPTSPEWPYFDNRFILFYRQQVKEVRRRLLTGSGLGGTAGGGADGLDDGSSKYLEVIAEQEKEINFLKVRIEKILVMMQELQERGKMSPLPMDHSTTPEAFSSFMMPSRSPRGNAIKMSSSSGDIFADLQNRALLGELGAEAMVALADIEAESQLRKQVESDLSTRDAQLRGLAQMMEGLQGDLSKKEEYIASLLGQMESRVAEVDSLKQKAQEAVAAASVSNQVDEEEDDESANLMAANFELRGEIETIKERLIAREEELASSQDELRKNALELQRAGQRERKLLEEKTLVDGRMAEIEHELETVTHSYQEVQQQLEKVHKAMHIESQKLKRSEEEKERMGQSLAEYQRALDDQKAENENLLQRLSEERTAKGLDIDMNGRISDLEKQLHEAQARETHFREVQNEEVGNLHRQLDEAETKMLAAHAQAAEASKQLEDLSALRMQELIQTGETLNSLKSEAETHRRQAHEAKAREAEVVGQLQALESEVEVLRSQVAGGSPEQQQHEVTRLQSALAEARQKEEALRAEFEDMKYRASLINDNQQPASLFDDQHAASSVDDQHAASLFDDQHAAALFDDQQTALLFNSQQQATVEQTLGNEAASLEVTQLQSALVEARQKEEALRAELEDIRSRASLVNDNWQAASSLFDSQPARVVQTLGDEAASLEELEREVGMAWGRVEDAENIARQWQEAANQYSHRIAELESNVSGHDMNVQGLIQEAGRLTARIRELEATLASITKEKEEQDQLMASITKAKEEQDRSLASYQEEAAIQGQAARRLQAALDEGGVKQAHRIASLEESIRSDAAESQHLQAKIVELEEEVESARAALEREGTERVRLLASLEGRTARDGDEVDDLKRRNAELTKQLAETQWAVEQQAEALAESKDALDQATSCSHVREEANHAQLQAQVNMIEDLRGDISQLHRTVQESHEAEQRGIREFQQVLQKKKETILQLRQELDAATTAAHLFPSAAEMEGNAAQNQQQLVEAQTRIKELESQVASLLDEAATAKAASDASSFSLVEAEEVAHLKAEAERLHALLLEKEAALLETHQQLEEARLSLQQKETLLSRAPSSSTSSPSRERKEAELLQTIAQQDDVIREFEEDRAVITKQFQALIAEKRAEADRLVVERHELTQRLMHLEGHISNQESSLQSVTADLANALEGIRLRDDELEKLRDRFEALATRRSEMAELLEDQAVKKAKIVELQKQVAELEGQLQAAAAGWRGLVEEKDREMRGLRKEVEVGREEQGNLQEEITEAQGTILSLLDAVSISSPSLNASLEQPEEENQATRHQQQEKQYEQEIANLRERILDLETELRGRIDELGQLKAENAAVVVEAEQMRDEQHQQELDSVRLREEIRCSEDHLHAVEQQHQEEMSASREEVRRLEEQLYYVNNQHQNELGGARKEARQLEAEMYRLNQEHQHIMEVSREEVRRLQEQLHEVEGSREEVRQLEEYVQRLNQEHHHAMEVSSEEVRRMKEQLHHVSEDSQGFREEIRRLEEQLLLVNEDRGSREQVQQLEGYIQQLNQEHQHALEVSRKEVRRFQEQLHHVNEDRQIGEEIRQLQEHIDRLNQEHQQAIEVSMEQVRRLEEQLHLVNEDRQREVEGLSEEVRRLQDQLRHSQAEVDRWTAEAHATEARSGQQASEAEEEVLSLKVRIEALERELQRVEEEAEGIRHTAAAAAVETSQLQSERQATQDGEVSRVIACLLDLLQKNLGQIDIQISGGGLTEQLQGCVEEVLRRWKETENVLKHTEEELDKAFHDIQGLKARVDEDNKRDQLVAVRLREVQQEKETVEASLQAELDELRIALARQGQLNGHTTPAAVGGRSDLLSPSSPARGRDVNAGRGGEKLEKLVDLTKSAGSTGSTGGGLMLEGALLEISSLRTDNEALHRKYLALSEESSCRLAYATEVIEQKDQAIASISREVYKLKNEMDFNAKLKATLLEDRDRDMQQMSRKMAEQRRNYQAQVDALEARVMATEEENEALHIRLESLAERHENVLKNKEKMIADLKAEVERRGQQDRSDLAQLQRSVKEKEEAVGKLRSQLANVKTERDRLQTELEDLRLNREENLRDTRRELAAALEAKAELQLELNARELQFSAMKRDVNALQADAAKYEGLMKTHREMMVGVRERERRIESLESELKRTNAQRDSLKEKLDETWSRSASDRVIGGSGEGQQIASSETSMSALQRGHLRQLQQQQEQQYQYQVAGGRGGGYDSAASSSLSYGGAAQLQQPYLIHHHQHHASHEMGAGGRFSGERVGGPPPGGLFSRPAANEIPSASHASSSASITSHYSLEDDLRFLQNKLTQLRNDLGEERVMYKQLEWEHEGLLEVLAQQEVRHQHHMVEHLTY